MFDMESLPTAPSEEFRQQSSALAQTLTLKPSRTAAVPTPGVAGAGAGAGGFFDQAWGADAASRPAGSTTAVGDASTLLARGTVSESASASAYDMPRFGSPANMELKMSAIKPRKGSLASNLSLPTTTRGPISGNSARSQTLPPSSKVDGLSLMYPSKLVGLLSMMPKEDILLLDLRPYAAFSSSRIEGSLNLSIPTTLLKRPSFKVAKLI